MKKNFKAGIIFSILFTGCATATMVKHPNQDANSKYAPSNDKQYGVIKYLNQGADSIINKRREDALKQMYESCGGKYKVAEEGAQFSGKYNTFTSLGNSEYIYIRFECE